MVSTASRSRPARSPRLTVSIDARSNSCSALTSSMTALMAVLK